MNLNTIILGIIMMVMSWVGYETSQNGKDAAVLKAGQILQHEAIQELSTKVGGTVSREEFSQFKMTMETKWREIDVELTKLRQQRNFR